MITSLLGIRYPAASSSPHIKTSLPHIKSPIPPKQKASRARYDDTDTREKAAEERKVTKVQFLNLLMQEVYPRETARKQREAED